MTKRILIPTDFSIESLNFLKTVIEQKQEGVKLEIVLLYGIQTGDSIRDLLFFSKSQLLKKAIPTDFEEGCNIILNKYANEINGIIKDIFTGYTQAAFDNLMEGLSVDEICISANNSPSFDKKNGINLMPYIRKSKVKKTELPYRSPTYIVAKNNLSQVFAGSVMQ
jgi:hypothetical protein